MGYPIRNQMVEIMRVLVIPLVLLFLVTCYSNADYLNTKTSNQCVYDVTPYQDHKGLCYTKRSNDNSYCNSKLRFKDLISGYELKGSDCVLKNDLKITGLTQSEWDYSLAFIAHVLGFTMLFLINFLSVLIARK